MRLSRNEDDIRGRIFLPVYDYIVFDFLSEDYLQVDIVLGPYLVKLELALSLKCCYGNDNS